MNVELFYLSENSQLTRINSIIFTVTLYILHFKIHAYTRFYINLNCLGKRIKINTYNYIGSKKIN